MKVIHCKGINNRHVKSGEKNKNLAKHLANTENKPMCGIRGNANSTFEWVETNAMPTCPRCLGQAIKSNQYSLVEKATTSKTDSEIVAAKTKSLATTSYENFSGNSITFELMQSLFNPDGAACSFPSLDVLESLNFPGFYIILNLKNNEYEVFEDLREIFYIGFDIKSIRDKFEKDIEIRTNQHDKTSKLLTLINCVSNKRAGVHFYINPFSHITILQSFYWKIIAELNPIGNQLIDDNQ